MCTARSTTPTGQDRPRPSALPLLDAHERTPSPAETRVSRWCQTPRWPAPYIAPGLRGHPNGFIPSPESRNHGPPDWVVFGPPPTLVGGGWFAVPALTVHGSFPEPQHCSAQDGCCPLDRRKARHGQPSPNRARARAARGGALAEASSRCCGPAREMLTRRPVAACNACARIHSATWRLCAQSQPEGRLEKRCQGRTARRPAPRD